MEAVPVGAAVGGAGAVDAPEGVDVGRQELVGADADGSAVLLGDGLEDCADSSGLAGLEEPEV